MSFVAHVHPDQRTLVRDGAPLGELRSSISAVTHLDYSARIQTVDPERHPRFHRLLSAFARHTGCPVLINTSLNVRGEPIANSIDDAYHCLVSTGMDVLVVEDVILFRNEQPAHVHKQPRVSLD
jgi:carbamoyltransferase